MNFFNDLKTDPLNKHISAIIDTVNQLEIDFNDLSNIATDNSKDINRIKKNVDWMKTFLKHLNDCKADKQDIKGVFLYNIMFVQYNRLPKKVTRFFNSMFFIGI